MPLEAAERLSPVYVLALASVSEDGSAAHYHCPTISDGLLRRTESPVRYLGADRSQRAEVGPAGCGVANLSKVTRPVRVWSRSAGATAHLPRHHGIRRGARKRARSRTGFFART